MEALGLLLVGAGGGFRGEEDEVAAEGLEGVAVVGLDNWEAAKRRISVACQTRIDSLLS